MECTLMHKDIPVVDLLLDEEIGYITKVNDIHDNHQEIGNMVKEKKAFKVYLIRSFWILLKALCIFIITLWIWEVTDGNRLIAYLLNGLTIIIVTLEDKNRHFQLKKRKNKPPVESKFKRIIMDYIILDKHDSTSIKASLYLFYMFSLVTSQIMTLNLHWDTSEDIRGYFSTVGYALVILVAFDKFIEQVMKDDKLKNL